MTYIFHNDRQFQLIIMLAMFKQSVSVCSIFLEYWVESSVSLIFFCDILGEFIGDESSWYDVMLLT